MRLLGLDVGDRTIGVAVSDALGITAQGITCIKREEIENDMDILKGIIEEYKIEKAVVGYPKNMNGTIGPQCVKVEEFSRLLEEKFNIKAVLWDERLTTAAAEKMLISADVSRKKRKKVIDKLAAIYILQSYLDSIY